MPKPKVTEFDAYYEHILYDDPRIDYDRLRLVRDVGNTALLGEWVENNERWEMRLSSTDGVVFRGEMKSKDYDPMYTYVRLWELKDALLWVGYYDDAGEESPIWIHAMPLTAHPES